MAGVHEDFGEKIGGAKKDLWKDRGLYADDLEAMNEREAEKFVKKDNVWKKPDYAAMLEEGIPLGVVYFIKKARDGLNASPQYYRTDDTPEKRTARQKEYIKTVREYACVQLTGTDKTLQQISEELHYSSRSYFTAVFRKVIGCSPTEYRNNGGNKP